ncbi:iron ABC transporter permease [Staphylococcus caprae]|nr:iron ABC transporter permease [Staphylococcus sp. HMSC62A08]OHS37225.1 heme ABC transporter permease [Staphylococcus sp. HMSC62A08]
MFQQHPRILVIISLILLCITIYISFVIGTIPIHFKDILQKLSTGEASNIDTIIDLRLPRILIALCVGAMLSASGALLQAVLQNPLAEAQLLGVSSGALVARTILLLLAPQLFFYIPLLSFVGGMLPFLMLFILSVKFKLLPTRMILIGVAMFAMLTGLLDLFAQNPFLKMPQGFTMKTWNDVKMIVLSAVIGLAMTIILMSKVNLLALEEKQANNLGFHITKYRLIVGMVAVFLASASSAIVGPLAFVGLIIPHIVRKLIGANYKQVLPLSIIIGAWFVVMTDLLGRTIHPPLEIPANVIMMLIGGPVLIYLICKGAVNDAY